MHLSIDFNLQKETILNHLSKSKDSFWVNEIVLFLEEWWNDDDFIIAQSSGSTGEAKTMKLRKNKVVNSAIMTGDFFSFDENTTGLLCMSPKFIAGKLMLVRAIVWKMNLICVKPSSSPLESISEKINIDFAAMVPLQLQNSVPYLSSLNLSKLIVGGGAVSDKLLSNISKVNTEIYSSYGMTETITHVALKRLNGDEPNGNFTGLKGITFGIDERDCLKIYAKELSDEVVVTNDIVDLINDKEFDWVGRFDNVINSGGVKINPEKVENLLSDYILSPFMIGSIPDDDLGEKVVLIVEGESQNINLDFIKSLVPKYQNPKDVFFVDEFVRTESEKVNRNKTLKKITL